jgi:hypothetical protein
MKSEYLHNLALAIQKGHGCECEHSGTSTVVEFYEGQKVFEGSIETFTLSGHPQATLAFAWGFHNGTEPQYVAVLNIPPINDPSDAVRAAIASGHF